MDEPTVAPGSTHEDLIAHGNALLRYALARVGEHALAEDLVQDTLVTAVGKLSEFAGASSMRTWLVGILRHKILDHFRWKQRHPGDQPMGDDADADEPDPWFTRLGRWRSDPNQGLEALDADPAAAFERSELRAALQFCIDHLPKKLHHVFVLRDIDELAPDEAAAAAGISHDSLAVFLYRARQSLRACLQKKWIAT